LLEGNQLTGEALLDYFDLAWKQQLKDGGDRPVRYNQEETDQSLHPLAERMLATFLNSPLARPKGQILGVEEQLQVTLDNDLPDVLAKVDLVTVTDRTLHVIDFKTSRSRWNDEKALQSAEQLVLYGVTVGRLSKSLGRPVELNFAVITKGKNPATQLIRVPTDPNRIELMKQSVSACWEAMRSGNFYPAPSPAACTTCPYRDRCPVFAGSQ
jgi:RecB family exonuclease